MLSTIEQKLIEEFKDNDKLSRAELLNFLKSFEPEANLEQKIANLEQTKFIDSYRVGTYGVFYRLKYKPEYKPEISDEIFRLSQLIQEQFGTEHYCIWNTDWLNEFTEYNQVKKLIIIEIEADLIGPLYDELKATTNYKLHRNPEENTINFNNSEGQIPVVIKPFIPKSPVLKRQIKRVNIHTPLLEKIVSDLFYYGASLGFITSKIEKTYLYSFSKAMSYTKLKLGNEDMNKFMTQISPPMKFYWKITKENKTHTLEIKSDDKEILALESTGHWKSEIGGTASFEEFLNGRWHDWLIPLYGENVVQEISNTIKYL